MNNLYFNIKSSIIILNYFKGYYFLKKSNLLNRELSQNFDEFKELALELENILDKEDFSQQDCYIEWHRRFKSVYGKENTNIHLYIIFSQIFYIAHLLVSQLLLKEDKNSEVDHSNVIQMEKIQKHLYKDFSTDISFLNPYFLPLFKFLEENFFLLLDKLKDYILKYILKTSIKPEYLFDYLFQKALKPLLRHILGEFYTPPFLVRMMVTKSYEYGDKILDPSCGTGNFLIEIIKSILSSENSEKDNIKALNNIYGFDINPMSIFLTIINIILLAGNKVKNLNTHFLILDTLFDKINLDKKKFDLIIGNPPWYTFRDISSVSYQNKVKKLAEDLQIKPSPKNILNIEIASLFFYKAMNSFMRSEAKIFFVITKGVITGSHASRFRNFEGFKDVKIWTFDKKIEKIFNIDFICLFARKTNGMNYQLKYQIPSVCFGLNPSIERLEYFDEIELITLKEDILVPYSIKRKGEKTYVHKLISKSAYSQLITIEPSVYKKQFHKGADLNPRNLIFINVKSKNQSLALINPDDRIFKRAKVPWNKKIFRNSVIEKDYIFKAVKSTELVKFYLYDYYYVFLPISRKNHDFNYSNLKTHGKAFYDLINRYYIQNKKATTKHKTLMDNLNRWSKLINERQFSDIKVVYNNSGSILSAAVVQGDFLVTGDLSFYDTVNLDEAYYLSAILNSNLINEQIKIKKSSRHIFKIPFENPIQNFDETDGSHVNLAQLGLQGEELVQNIIRTKYKKEKKPISRLKLQNRLLSELKHILMQIDETLKNQFTISK
jgi:hypothetical protein